MQRLCHATAVSTLPPPDPAAAPGYFSRGNPLTGDPASVITADHMNGLTEEMIGVITGAGLTPDIADNTQLLQAVLLLGNRSNRLINSQMNATPDAANPAPAGTTGSRYTADIWRVQSAGTTYASDTYAFTKGQTEVPANPKRYLRVTTASVLGGANYCRVTQPLEDVELYSGKTVTLLFWAKASVAGTPATVCFEQYFGPTGSASVPGIGKQKITLSTTWAQYVVTADIPSVSGKTINASTNTYLDAQLWVDAGADFSGITDTLGQQSVTVEITNATLVFGSVPLLPDIRALWLDNQLRRRYIQVGAYSANSPSSSGFWMAQTVGASQRQIFPTVYLRDSMRAAPTVTVRSPATAAAVPRNVSIDADFSLTQVEMTDPIGFVISAVTPVGSIAGHLVGFHWLADARF